MKLLLGFRGKGIAQVVPSKLDENVVEKLLPMNALLTQAFVPVECAAIEQGRVLRLSLVVLNSRVVMRVEAGRSPRVFLFVWGFSRAASGEKRGCPERRARTLHPTHSTQTHHRARRYL